MENLGKVVRVKVPLMIGADVVVGDVDVNEVGKVDAHMFRNLTEFTPRPEGIPGERVDRDLIRENGAREYPGHEHDYRGGFRWNDLFYANPFERK